MITIDPALLSGIRSTCLRVASQALSNAAVLTGLCEFLDSLSAQSTPVTGTPATLEGEPSP